MIFLVFFTSDIIQFLASELDYIYYWNCDTDEGDRFEFDNINNVFEYVVKYNIKQFLNQGGINVQRTTI